MRGDPIFGLSDTFVRISVMGSMRVPVTGFVQGTEVTREIQTKALVSGDCWHFFISWGLVLDERSCRMIPSRLRARAEWFPKLIQLTVGAGERRSGKAHFYGHCDSRDGQEAVRTVCALNTLNTATVDVESRLSAC